MIDDLYTEAKWRLKHVGLWRYREIILSDEFRSDDDHLQWVISAPVGEIAAWARRIARDCEVAT
jgi:hypothetical protein